MTRVGALTDASRCLRLPEARMARSCRPTPAGLSPRSKVRSARARSSASSCGKLPTRRIFQVCAKRSKYSSLVAGGGAIRTAAASRVGGGSFGLPVVDMIEVSERTRWGNEIAISWAIMPPIDAPTRCADLMPSTSISPIVSLAMSSNLGCGDRDLQEPQLEQFDGTQPLAAGQLARFANVAIVEPDHAKPAGRKLPAELVIPMDHLGSQSH